MSTSKALSMYDSGLTSARHKTNIDGRGRTSQAPKRSASEEPGPVMCRITAEAIVAPRRRKKLPASDRAERSSAPPSLASREARRVDAPRECNLSQRLYRIPKWVFPRIRVQKPVSVHNETSHRQTAEEGQ